MYFESHCWWEIHKHRVQPGYLISACPFHQTTDNLLKNKQKITLIMFAKVSISVHYDQVLYTSCSYLSISYQLHILRCHLLRSAFQHFLFYKAAVDIRRDRLISSLVHFNASKLFYKLPLVHTPWILAKWEARIILTNRFIKTVLFEGTDSTHSHSPRALFTLYFLCKHIHI